MEFKILTTVTAMRSRVGVRAAYTYSTIDGDGQTIRRNSRGSIVLTKAMKGAAEAVQTLEDFLTAKLPEGKLTGVLTSFCTFHSVEGTVITYMYDEIDEGGAVATKNNQATITLVPGHMDQQITAVRLLWAFLDGKI